MAIYKPDYKLIEAQKIISNLGDSKEEGLIKYYIKNQEERIKQQNEELLNYKSFFNQLNNFLTNKNINSRKLK